MTLTGKDLVTTLLVMAAGGLYFAMAAGLKLPLISGYRGAILLLTIIGIAMCALSGGTTPATGAWAIIAGTLGVVALVVIIYGLLTGAKIAFVLLTITIVVLWAVATVRHLLAL
jgi:hypothetical protein